MAKENEVQMREYVPVGPVRLRQPPAPAAEPQVRVVERVVPYRVGVPVEQRLPGRVYDADSGLPVGSASEEVKAKRKVGEVWEDTSGGMKRRLVRT